MRLLPKFTNAQLSSGNCEQALSSQLASDMSTPLSMRKLAVQPPRTIWETVRDACASQIVTNALQATLLTPYSHGKPSQHQSCHLQCRADL